MKIIIESTTQITEVNGVPARVWEGHTETGIKVICLVTRIAVSKDEDPEVLQFFEKELQECKAPSPEVAVYPLRMII